MNLMEMKKKNLRTDGIHGQIRESSVMNAEIKALKTLVWHLSRELMKEMRYLKNKQTVIYDEQVRTNKAKD